MIKLLLAFDDRDETLGPYFSICASNARDIFKSIAEIHEVNSYSLNYAYMETKLPLLNSNNFLCFVYSHGNDTSFRAREPFIGSASAKMYCNSLFYTFSCRTGNGIGLELIDNGCHAFIGYKTEASIVVGYIDDFVTCANHGLVRLVSGDKASEAVEKMRNTYTEYIDKNYAKDFLVASILMDNRDALILHGNGDLTIDIFDLT